MSKEKRKEKRNSKKERQNTHPHCSIARAAFTYDCLLLLTTTYCWKIFSCGRLLFSYDLIPLFSSSKHCIYIFFIRSETFTFLSSNFFNFLLIFLLLLWRVLFFFSSSNDILPIFAIGLLGFCISPSHVFFSLSLSLSHTKIHAPSFCLPFLFLCKFSRKLRHALFSPLFFSFLFYMGRRAPPPRGGGGGGWVFWGGGGGVLVFGGFKR